MKKKKLELTVSSRASWGKHWWSCSCWSQREDPPAISAAAHTHSSSSEQRTENKEPREQRDTWVGEEQLLLEQIISQSSARTREKPQQMEFAREMRGVPWPLRLNCIRRACNSNWPDPGRWRSSTIWRPERQHRASYPTLWSISDSKTHSCIVSSSLNK